MSQQKHRRLSHAEAIEINRLLTLHRQGLADRTIGDITDWLGKKLGRQIGEATVARLAKQVADFSYLPNPTKPRIKRKPEEMPPEELIDREFAKITRSMETIRACMGVGAIKQAELAEEGIEA